MSEDSQLVRIVATLGLLIATALAPPYLAAPARRASENQLGQLGPFVVASALAAVSSTYVWGRLSDVSSRKVLALSAVVAAGVLALAALRGFLLPSVFKGVLIAPALLFVPMIACQGVRLGRPTHIVVMADRDTREVTRPDFKARGAFIPGWIKSHSWRGIRRYGGGWQVIYWRRTSVAIPNTS